jgi:hypothetical protein
MGRSKKFTPVHVEPDVVLQAVPDEETVVETGPTHASAASIIKADACRAALAEGIEIDEEAMSFTRSRFGIEIRATDLALYKSKEKARQAATAPKAGRKPREASPAVTRSPAATKPVPAATGQADLLDALTDMKPLIAQNGAAKIKQMVDLLG